VLLEDLDTVEPELALILLVHVRVVILDDDALMAHVHDDRAEALGKFEPDEMVEHVCMTLTIDGKPGLEYIESLRHGTFGGDPPAGGGGYVSVPTWHQSLAQR
jgi:hypothetical protein